MKKILSILPLVIICGCIEPPANVLRLHTPKGDYVWTSPKNVTMEGLKAVVNPDGTIDIVVNKISSTNDPMVIDKSSAGQAAITSAHYQGLQSILTELEKMQAGMPKVP